MVPNYYVVRVNIPVLKVSTNTLVLEFKADSMLEALNIASEKALQRVHDRYVAAEKDLAVDVEVTSIVAHDEDWDV